MPPAKPKQLPHLVEEKIYKTGQTRGADNDVIYQNRVLRNNTVLIPYVFWDKCRKPSPTEEKYENGYIVLITATEYFKLPTPEGALKNQGLLLGKNLLVIYETRQEWEANNPDSFKWKVASQRVGCSLGGEYVARVPATTSSQGGEKVNVGFTATTQKGAGIRVYEYASKMETRM
ncbi:MAG: BstXI family restriction endonuclease [Planctomycetota bacterium]